MPGFYNRDLNAVPHAYGGSTLQTEASSYHNLPINSFSVTTLHYPLLTGDGDFEKMAKKKVTAKQRYAIEMKMINQGWLCSL